MTLSLTTDDPAPQVDANNPNDTFDPEQIVWVLDNESLHQLHETIPRSGEVVIDLETTGLNEHQRPTPEWPVPARIVMASITLPDQWYPDVEPPTFVVPLSHPDSPWRGRWRWTMAGIANTIKRSGKPITNQHLKFDLRWIFAHTGVDLSRQFSWDPMYSSHLLDENSPTKLKVRAPATFGIRRWDDHDLSKPGAAEKVPLFELGVYAARDTYWTWKLSKHHRQLMNVGDESTDGDPEDREEAELWRLGKLASWSLMPTGATLTQMEQHGIRLDREWSRDKLAELTAIVQETTTDLVSRYDDVESDNEPSFAPTSLWFRAWTEAAVRHGDLQVAALTGSGNPQWNKSVLKRQANRGSEVAKVLLTYREAAKRAEFVVSWLQLVTADGKIHANYNAGRTDRASGTVTGRLSSSNPNMQQVTKSLKPAFVPTPGYLIAEIDYSQIELRAAAFIARCEPMLEAYRRGDDLHRLFAAQLTGKDPKDVTAEERQHAKAGNFGLLYGMSPDGFQTYALDVYDVELSEEEAVQTHALFFQTWTGMSEWHARVQRQAHRTGQVVSPLGRIRRLPDIASSNKYLSSEAERQAVNSPVQGFASDLMQTAAASIAGNIPSMKPIPGVRIVGTVHDSIVIEVPQDDWKRATARCMHRMINLHPVLEHMGCHLDVPLAAEATVGTRWGLGDVGVIS